MSTPIVIRDDDNHQAKVVDGGLLVSPVPAPASELDTLTAPYVGFMTPTGKGGNEALTVDGSGTPVDAFINAEAKFDIYIKEIKVLIEAPGLLELSDFGDITGGLTNGLTPYFLNVNQRLDFSERPLLTNFDVIRVGSKTPSLGADENSFRIKGAKAGGQGYGYLAVWDMSNLAPGNIGIRLRANSGQQLGVQIADNLTGLTAFEILCVGYRRFL